MVDPQALEKHQEAADGDETMHLEDTEVVGLSVIPNIQYDNDLCSMILFRNWTHNFKYQFALTQKELQEMITATVSHEMRTPVNAILNQLVSLEQEVHGRASKMTRIIKNSAKMLLYLVNDMLDVYMIKNGRFEKKYEPCIIANALDEVFDMFVSQAETKGITLNVEGIENVPHEVTSDERRLK